MEKEINDNFDYSEDEISGEEIGGTEAEVSIREFIKRKKLQNRILGEIIEKIRSAEITEKKNNPNI